MNIKSAAVFLFIIFTSKKLVSCKCTQPNSGTTPCSCDDEQNGATLHCSGITDEHALKEIYSLFESSAFDELEISDSDMSFVPTDAAIFDDAKTLQLARCSLDFLFADVPPSSLDTLVVDDVEFSHGMTWEYLEDVPNLENLIVRNAELPAFDAEFSFSVSRKLRTIILKNTNTSYVEDYAFKHHVYLSDLRIESADVTELKRNMLPRPAEMLVVLSFADNKIAYLPKDFFVQMPLLKIVDLSYNQVKQIPSSLSGIYKRIQTLSLEGNPVECDCRLQWITWRSNTSTHPADRNRKVEGVCSSPDRLIGVELIDLTARDFRHCKAHRLNKLAKNVIAMRVRKMNRLINSLLEG